MFSHILKPCPSKFIQRTTRYFSTTKQNNIILGCIGGAGGIGQPFIMLMKASGLVTELRVHDLVKHNAGVCEDCSHIDTPCIIKEYTGVESMRECLKGVHIVAIPAGVPRKPGMDRDDLFRSNASVARDVAQVCAEVCPDALVAIITNPINILVPIFCEVMRKAGKLNPNRVFGVSTLDSVRTSTFIAQAKNLDPGKVKAPVIGGHSGVSIIPLISRCTPPVEFSNEQLDSLSKRIQNAGSVVLQKKVGTGTATLAMAYAASRMVQSLIKGLNGEPNVIECSYVMSDVADTKYFATPLLLGKNGIEQNLGIGEMSQYEKEQFKKACAAIKKNVEKGEKYVKS